MKYDEQNLINQIKTTSPNAQVAIRALFNNHKHLVNVVSSMYKLSLEERQSAYADAILAVVDAIKNEKYKGEASIKTYLSRIFNNKCVDLCKKNATVKRQVHRTEWIDDFLHLSDNAKSAINEIIQKELVAELMEKLEKIGKKCKELLLAVGEGFPTAEIVSKFGYKDTKSLKSMKYKCVQKLLKHYI